MILWRRLQRSCAVLGLLAGMGPGHAGGEGRPSPAANPSVPVAAGAAQGLSVRLINDQASTLTFRSAPARSAVAFELERRTPAGNWEKVQPLETSFCLNPCPAPGDLPGELDCGRPPRTRVEVRPGGHVDVGWSGEVVEEVARRHSSGRTRTCTLVHPAPPGSYRLSLCAEPATAADPQRCAALTFAWPPRQTATSAPQFLRWSTAVVAPAR